MREGEETEEKDREIAGRKGGKENGERGRNTDREKRKRERERERERRGVVRIHTRKQK